MKKTRHIALIGCGFTGTSAFFQLVDKYPIQEITIFEETGDFGPGYAYRRDECPDYLLNNTTNTMCLVPSNRTAFVEWLRGRPDLVSELEEDGYVPRYVFGHFLKDVFESTRTIAAIKGIKVNLIPQKVIAMNERETGLVNISWGNGETKVDAAILTTGRCPEKEFIHSTSSKSVQYVASHIQNEELDTIPLDATVSIMGASLSAYDVINRLFSTNTGCSFKRDANGKLVFESASNKRHINLYSRTGRLKAIQSQKENGIIREWLTIDRLRDLAKQRKLNLTTIGSLIEKDAIANGVKLDIDQIVNPYSDCSSISDFNRRVEKLLIQTIENSKNLANENFLVDFFKDAEKDLWKIFTETLLPVSEEEQYRKVMETAVMCYAAPCPLPTIEKLLALLQGGRLKFIKGVKKVELKENKSYNIEHEFGEESADILVNTTGSVNRIVSNSQQSTLTKSLFQNGLLSPYTRESVSMNGADIEYSSYLAKGAQNIYVANMFLWGPCFYTSSAFVMAKVVDDILNNLFKE